MDYFLGIDGGGTKTAFLLVDETGNQAAFLKKEGCSYKEIGMEQAVRSLEEGVKSCLMQANIQKADLKGMVIGLPCYGESKKGDENMERKLREIFSSIPFSIANDVEVGCAGSLGMKSGIHLVSGTGSIAYGRNKKGDTIRSGGWSSFFSDEGSCYWLGRKTMELFSKQADGRIKKDRLFSIVMEKFQLAAPEDFIDRMEEEYIPKRSKVASFQRVLLLAAKEGDSSAIALYREAAMELNAMVVGIATKLNFPGEEFFVSYFGGLFHAGQFVLPYLEKEVKKLGGHLISPELEPVEGAVLMSIDYFSSIDIETMKKRMQNGRIICR